MKKVILSLLIIVLMFLCCSCGLFGPRDYFCNVNEVETIQIVRLEKLIKEEYRYEYTVLTLISDYETFVNRLNNMKHSVNWGDPIPLNLFLEHIVIKIDYRNGDFDLIHSDAQVFHRSGDNHSGYFYFDDEQFNSLLSDYMTE